MRAEGHSEEPNKQVKRGVLSLDFEFINFSDYRWQTVPQIGTQDENAVSCRFLLTIEIERRPAPEGRGPRRTVGNNKVLQVGWC